MRYKIVLSIVFLSFASQCAFCAKESSGQAEGNIAHRGIWLTCFSEKRVRYSKESVLELIDFCKRTKTNAIYLQFYRAGQAYYDSQLTDKSKYEEMVKAAGLDTIDFLLELANKNGIKIFAWVNLLSIANNREANILTKLGDSALTKDQYLRPSLRNEQVNDLDSYYLRDNQLFLEPGDLRVQKYILAIIDEIITRYPSLAGIHLDYIRYPHPVPYLPDSRFNKYGLTYGYGEENISRFKEATGLEPLSMDYSADNCLKWDDWKRKQVTDLVRSISQLVKDTNSDLLLSCAVIPSAERAYLAAFQDWPFWLEEGIVDYAVIMNYTRDKQFAKEIIRSALSHCGKGKIFVGLGAFLMKEEPESLAKQCRIARELGAPGIIFFSYDDLAHRRDNIFNP